MHNIRHNRCNNASVDFVLRNTVQIHQLANADAELIRGSAHFCHHFKHDAKFFAVIYTEVNIGISHIYSQ